MCGRKSNGLADRNTNPNKEDKTRNSNLEVGEIFKPIEPNGRYPRRVRIFNDSIFGRRSRPDSMACNILLFNNYRYRFTYKWDE